MKLKVYDGKGKVYANLLGVNSFKDIFLCNGIGGFALPVPKGLPHPKDHHLMGHEEIFVMWAQSSLVTPRTLNEYRN